MKPKSGLFAFLGSARAAVGSFRKIGQFFDHLNFEKYEPGSLYVGPFLAKIFLKIDEIKIRPLTPPQNHFNTLPVLVADACIQEGWEKSARVGPTPRFSKNSARLGPTTIYDVRTEKNISWGKNVGKKSLPWERGKQKGDNYIDFTCLVDGRCH